MAPRFLCLQGHLWSYPEDAGERPDKAIFCPTCGLRLYTEAQAASIPVRSQHFFPSPPTPMNSIGADPAPAIQANDIEAIPGYELLGILGRGGMGIVFRARQLSLKRQVALKMILTGRQARPAERARFQREAEAVARLQHPNIVQIYEVGEQNGLPYFSLEFVNAGSLAQFLGNQPQSPRMGAALVEELALAMHYAHKRGIVHRDLKPANILLHLDESAIFKDGQLTDSGAFRNLLMYVPKITDFGLAKHVGGEEAFRGTIVGTPSYMAPEQARGTSGEIGPAADVYALGAILYEMLTGRPPFNAATPDETAQQVLGQEPPPPTQIQPRVPRDLETICLVCLQKNPAHRYGNAEALAEDLRRFLANEPILARRTHLPERVVKWAIRRPLMATLSLVLLIATLLLWWTWWQRVTEFQQEKQQLVVALQSSEDQLLQAIQTIDQMADQPDRVDRLPLLKAKAFYEHLVDQDGPPARVALAHYRLGRIHERLGDDEEAQASYREAIARWEKLAQDWPADLAYPSHLQDGRERLQRLAGRRKP
ncbi:MAG TPA: protein kinase [Gemmataceae bacterium]|nr:protein kinase [Gemmataceae bacterium]